MVCSRSLLPAAERQTACCWSAQSIETRAAYSDMFGTSNSDGFRSGTCFAWLCEIVIVESSWLTTTEYSLVSQGSSRVCETVRLSVGGKPGAISSRKGQKLSTNQNQHELSAAANRWIFVTPARMFLPLLSLSRILPAVMLSSGTENLLSYNKSLGRPMAILSSPGRRVTAWTTHDGIPR